MKNEQMVLDNMNLVYFLLRKYYPNAANDEDVIQCGMLGLCNAVNNWDESKSKFSTYAAVCILNSFRAEFRRRQKYQYDYSLDRPIKTQDGENLTYQDLIVSEPDIDFIDYDGFYNKLSEDDQKLIDLISLGMKQCEVAEILGESESSISRKLTSIKKKWRKFSDEH